MTTTPLFVSRFGAGRPFLCLHGIEAHGLRYVALAARLPGLHVVAPDLRGHGRSPAVGPWTLAQHVSDLSPLLASLGPATVVLGHSYGGLVAWELARAMPDGLAGLVLVDPAISVNPSVAEEGIAANAGRSRWPDERAALEALLALRQPGAYWAAALDFAHAVGPAPAGGLRPLVEPDAVDAGWAQMRRPVEPTRWRGPTLLLEAGREDGRYVSREMAMSMQRQLQGALQHVVLDAGHTITSDHPDLLAEHLADFLRAIGEPA